MIPVQTSFDFFRIVLEPPSCLDTEIPAPGNSGAANWGFVPHVQVVIDLPPAGLSAMLSAPPFGSRGEVYPAHREAPVLLEIFVSLSADTLGGQRAVDRMYEIFARRPAEMCPTLRLASFEQNVQWHRRWWHRAYVYHVCDEGSGEPLRADAVTLADLTRLHEIGQRVLEWVVCEEFRIFRCEKDPADTTPAELFR
jgi:hypothetical protein